jgi:hypothetical protein
VPDGDTGAGEDGLEHEEHQLVELVSSGRSCPICEAPDGMCFEEDPTPIHDLCDCEVRLGERSTTYRPPGERECGENQWELDWNLTAYPSDEYATQWTRQSGLNRSRPTGT